MTSFSLTAQLLFAELWTWLSAKVLGKTSSEFFPIYLSLVKNAYRGSPWKAGTLYWSFWPTSELTLQNYKGFMVSSLAKMDCGGVKIKYFHKPQLMRVGSCGNVCTHRNRTKEKVHFSAGIWAEKFASGLSQRCTACTAYSRSRNLSSPLHSRTNIEMSWDIGTWFWVLLPAESQLSFSIMSVEGMLNVQKLSEPSCSGSWFCCLYNEDIFLTRWSANTVTCPVIAIM